MNDQTRTLPRSGAQNALRAALAGLALLAASSPAVAAMAFQPDELPGTRERGAVDQSPPEGPGGADPTLPAVNLDDENCSIEFSETAEPMDLTALVDFVANTLAINISIRGELKGSVLFNTAREVPCDRLLPLLDAMLEQNDFSITYDSESAFYLIQPTANIPVVFGDDLASTKLIEIPTITPSSLSDPISQILGAGGAQGGAAGVSFIDELGLIVITNTPRQIARVEELIGMILSRLENMSLTPIELRYISAPSARERLISLVGGDAASATGGLAGLANRTRQANVNNANPAMGPSGGGSLENLAQRLSIDPQSNALLFRGTDDELKRVLAYIDLIDVENQLKARRHFVGSAARQLAEFAKQRGLGEVIILDDTQDNNQFGSNRGFVQQQQGNPLTQNQTESVAGPTLVVDVRNGEIVYYGTEDQQEVLAEMISTLDTEADRVVIRQYKLDHAVAEEVAEVINALLTGDTGLGQGGLLPQGGGVRTQQQVQQNFGGDGADGEIGGGLDPTQVFVVADVPNNQIIVKAPVKQQEDMAQLIERLDLRRRQVYLETLIVSVSDSDTFRFAIDTQFQIGQFRGQTNFGLTEAGTDFIDSRSPISTLGGLTTALIKNEYLPFVINAIKNETDGKILSKPQLLVNDNEEATIASIRQEPTTTTNQGDATTTVSFQGYEDAGTTLTVTPGISEAGFLRLAYEIEFSNFTGSGSDGVPPPRNNQNVVGSVTMPTDTTIVVGGITVDDVRNTVIKVPLLGDIPIIGKLFSDTNEVSTSSLLYIFITPKILVDPDFRDLRQLTTGPQFEAEMDPSLPALEPIAIDRYDSPNRD